MCEKNDVLVSVLRLIRPLIATWAGAGGQFGSRTVSWSHSSTCRPRWINYQFIIECCSRLLLTQKTTLAIHHRILIWEPDLIELTEYSARPMSPWISTWNGRQVPPVGLAVEIQTRHQAVATWCNVPGSGGTRRPSDSTTDCLGPSSVIQLGQLFHPSTECLMIDVISKSIETVKAQNISEFNCSKCHI